MREALEQVKPPVILIHAQDRTLLHDIRRRLSPDSFVIGRMYKELGVQEAWLDDPDPAARGREFAEEILRYDFGLATETEGGRLLIDAWMSLNEIPRGPASFPGFQVDDEYRRRAAAYDAFQVAFREQLQQEGIEAVAFNFAAGNFIKPEHYLDWFPATLENYIYLGFHEYGWPALKPGPGVQTAALFYRTCMEGIRQRYGDRHKAIITEAGLTMAYGHPGNPDEGWLNLEQPLTEEEYWDSLQWYNEEMLKDDYVMGAALFEVGHGHRWVTFRHLGEDNEGRAIQIISRIAQLGGEQPPQPPAPNPPTTPETWENLATRLSALAASVDASRTLVAGLPEQAAALQDQLEPMVAALGEAPPLLEGVESALQRLSALDAALASQSGEDVSNLRNRIESVRSDLESMKAEAKRADDVRAELLALVAAAASDAAAARSKADLLSLLDGLAADVRTLQSKIGGPPATGPVPMPKMDDLRFTLPKHPDPNVRYPNREPSLIRRIVIHHTATSSSASPFLIARGQIQRRGLPGITYHFTVGGDGTISWTEPLETETTHTNNATVNRESVGVALIGNFNDAPPDDAQLDAAAHVVAWLLGMFKSTTTDVVGRSEIEPTSSPGRQWLTGARYKDALLARVDALLSAER
ncbi:MAG: N-acetylmuramoyl-L-alanine amidase [Chloroflexi bacterium]|nr:N-acetylmuramoyl-L-alanine amidase [Chloroflexota bacterium]